jgi:nitroreductase
MTNNQQFDSLQQIISNRRTIKPAQMNGNAIPNDQIEALIALADWAPTHGRTEPWRFYIYGTESKETFCAQHAELYKSNTDEAAFSVDTFNNLSNMGNQASHILIAVMKRGNLPKIPAFEEVAATAAAIQNLLLGAEALNIAAYWGTGGMILKPAMKQYLNLGDEDQVMGVLYLGYSDHKPDGKRNTPLAEKAIWM